MEEHELSIIIMDKLLKDIYDKRISMCVIENEDTFIPSHSYYFRTDFEKINIMTEDYINNRLTIDIEKNIWCINEHYWGYEVIVIYGTELNSELIKFRFIKRNICDERSVCYGD